MTEAMAIFLIRHAETMDNATRTVQLPTAALSARGLEQAERLAERLARAGIARIVSSDFERARTTAARLQEKVNVPLELAECLRERDFGDIRGTPYSALGFDLFAPDYEPPGGESWAVFRERVDGAWETIRAKAMKEKGHLAVVTHGLVCHVLAERHLELPAGRAAPLRWGNTSVTVVEGSPPKKVALLDCTAHLKAEVDRNGGAV